MTLEGMPSHAASSPLRGTRVLEFEGLGVVPYVGMLLTDLGAEVVRVARPSSPSVLTEGIHRVDPAFDYTSRGRIVWRTDIKTDNPAQLWSLIRCADVLLEGFRPGVMERLGLGPDVVFGNNGQIVYARLSGLPRGQATSGQPIHDINVLALSGVLHTLAAAGRPPRVPLNLVVDYGAGSLLALAVVAQLTQPKNRRVRSLVDLSMLGMLSTMLAGFYGLVGQGVVSDVPGTSHLDGSAPWYTTYGTKDGRYLAVGAVEPRFYAAFLSVIGVDGAVGGDQNDRLTWAPARHQIQRHVRRQTLMQWMSRFEGIEACVSPVLTPREAAATAPTSVTFDMAGDWVQPKTLLGASTPLPARDAASCEIAEISERWTRQHNPD